MDELNVSQERFIRSTFLAFENSLRRIRSLITINDQGILFHRTNLLNRKDVGEILNRIDIALEMIKRYADLFHFEPFDEDIAHEIVAEMSISWQTLEECRPERIAGYGDLPKKSADLIDGVIDDLVEKALEILEITKSYIGAKHKNDR